MRWSSVKYWKYFISCMMRRDGGLHPASPSPALTLWNRSVWAHFIKIYLCFSFYLRTTSKQYLKKMLLSEGAHSRSRPKDGRKQNPRALWLRMIQRSVYDSIHIITLEKKKQSSFYSCLWCKKQIQKIKHCLPCLKFQEMKIYVICIKLKT